MGGGVAVGGVAVGAADWDAVILAAVTPGALYGAIDASPFYSNPVEPGSRSWMNVTFLLADPELDKKFVSEATWTW